MMHFAENLRFHFLPTWQGKLQQAPDAIHFQMAQGAKLNSCFRKWVPQIHAAATWNGGACLTLAKPTPIMAARPLFCVTVVQHCRGLTRDSSFLWEASKSGFLVSECRNSRVLFCSLVFSCLGRAVRHSPAFRVSLWEF